MTDPFAHGTPAGDHHTWVKPPSPDCPDCSCCTLALCSTAAERHTYCSALVGAGPDVMDVVGCPCSARPGGEPR